MTRRLTLAIVGTVAAALLLVGLGTLLLAGVGATQRAEEDLRAQAEATAQLVATATRGFANLGEAETQALVEQVCAGATATDEAARAADTRIRAALCAGALETPEEARVRICSEAWEGLATVVDGDAEATRATFCADPTAANLESFRRTLCDAPVIVESESARRQFVAAREALCRSVRREDRQQFALRQTLSAESIGLLDLSPDGTLEGGEPPTGVTLEELDRAMLADGGTVSGAVDGRVWAVAPIAVTDGVTAVVLERPVSTVGEALPFFLLASGLTLLAGAVVADRLGRRLTAPLRAATDATGRIAEGDLAVRLPEHPDRRRPDELDELGRSINAMTEALARAQGLERQFLLSVSHDLRTPLTSISGYAEAIADGAIEDPVAAAEIIRAESRRLERLVADLLDLAKLDARAFAFEVREVDLAAVARDAADGFARQVADAGLTLDLVVPEAPVPVAADPDRLGQVLANLAENACKYARHAVAVRVSAADRTVEVADDGPGIAADDLPHVFERLYVSKRTPVRAETGSGLGLAIVRELVEGMDGTVTASAGGAGGTRMVVSLPPPPAGAV